MSFGGWHSYQAWADHDFVPRKPGDEEPEPAETEDGAEPGEAEVQAGTEPDDEDGGEAAEETAGSGRESRTDDPGEDTVEWPRIDWPRQAPEQDEPLLTEADSAQRLRPYARTGGRTRADRELALETLVSTTEHGQAVSGKLPGDRGAICRLCREPISVAEVGARLQVPLGVARVLVSDLAGEGLVLVHDSAVPAGDGPSLDFMERVLVGLRNL